MGKEIDLEEVLLERELASRELIDYIRYVFKYIYKKPFYENWHHHYLCAVITSYLKGEIPLLLVSLPPSYGKTEICIKDAISFKLGNDQQYKSMYVSYGDELSTKTSVETRDIMQHPAYKNLFPKVAFKKGKDTHWSIHGGGGLFATTPTSATTGFHVKNIMIDDPVKTIEGHVKSALKKVIEFWDGTIQSRLEDWGDDTGSIMIVMQRQDINDLIGHIKKTRDDYVHICLEALNKEPIVYEWGDFKYERAANEPLFEAKHNLEKLQEMEKNSPSSFATQYKQDPDESEAGFFIKTEDIHFISPYDIPEQNLYILVDNAESLNITADNRAISCLGYSIDFTTKEELFVIQDLSYGIFDEDQTMEEIIRFMIKFETDVYIENKAGGITLARLLKKKILTVNAKLRTKGEKLIINQVNTFSPKRSISKNKKIMSGKTYTSTGNLKISNEADKKGVERYTEELLAFNPEKSNNKDDLLDVTVGSTTAEYIEPKVVGKPKKKKNNKRKKRKKSWNF